MSGNAFLKELVTASKAGRPAGICSVCSANEYVIEAAMEETLASGGVCLIEATANQVNQFGGYTGMTPADFVSFCRKIASRTGLDEERLIFGGDHLGPLVWSAEEEEAAMEKAEALVRAYAAAGIQKIHIDASMRLGSDDPQAPLDPAVVARRAARLCRAAEEARPEGELPLYVVGSEVPIPGGATEAEDGISVTRSEDLRNEYELFKSAFLRQGLDDAWTRVIAVVVQPGVEFGDDQVFLYNRSNAAELIACARTLDGIVLEGHSTDYQSARALREMREDGIAILKVGPALTYAFREALFALERIEREMNPCAPAGGYSDFSAVLDRVMCQNPGNWIKHYHGEPYRVALMRKYSLSDRSRYYLDNPEVQDATRRLFRNFNAAPCPTGLLAQFLPRQAEAIIAGTLDTAAEAIVKENIKYVLRSYR